MGCGLPEPGRVRPRRHLPVWQRKGQVRKVQEMRVGGRPPKKNGTYQDEFSSGMATSRSMISRTIPSQPSTQVLRQMSAGRGGSQRLEAPDQRWRGDDLRLGCVKGYRLQALGRQRQQNMHVVNLIVHARFLADLCIEQAQTARCFIIENPQRSRLQERIPQGGQPTRRRHGSCAPWRLWWTDSLLSSPSDSSPTCPDLLKESC